MSHDLALAQRHAYNLARTLMACVILFQGELGYGVMLADEYDGDAAAKPPSSMNTIPSPEGIGKRPGQPSRLLSCV